MDAVRRMLFCGLPGDRTCASHFSDRFHDLVFGHELGSGSFSVVKYARHITKGKSRSQWPEFAVKVISTTKIQVEHNLGFEITSDYSVFRWLLTRDLHQPATGKLRGTAPNKQVGSDDSGRVHFRFYISWLHRLTNRRALLQLLSLKSSQTEISHPLWRYTGVIAFYFDTFRRS